MSQLQFGGLREDHMPAVVRMVIHAFAGTVEQSTKWIREPGLENSRVLTDGGRPVASMLRIPMGQFFGGRSVPMIGIAGVAVAPEARGRGFARTLMREVVREMHAEGIALSCLYPSTQALYRQANYEQAGHRFIIRIPLAQINVRERAAAITPLEDVHHADVEACYREFAALNDGWLDRSESFWQRIRMPRDEAAPGFGVFTDGRLDGYAHFQQRRKDGVGRQELLVSDVAFRNAEAGRRLLGFFADFATVGEDLVFAGGPHHPLLWLLGQQRYTVTLKDYWMVALTNVKAALEARGYSGAVRTEIELDVVDEVTPANGGRCVLRVEGGRGAVERWSEQGSGDVARLNVRSLAALYTGFTSPKLLRAMGDLEASDRAVDALAAVFASGAPAMTDTF